MDLERLKYTELRNLAKSLGLKAKGKTDKLIRDISKYYEDNGTTTTTSSSSSSSPPTDKVPDVSVNSTASSEDNEIVFSTNPVPLETDAREEAEESIDEEIVFILKSAGKIGVDNELDKSVELANFEEKFVEIVEDVQNQSIEFEEHPATESEVVDEEVKEQLNTTFEIETDKDNGDDEAMEEDKEGGDQVDEKGEEDKENETKEEEKGDGVNDLLEVMRPEMTDEEMKAELLAAIDKKVQNRKVTIMSPNAASTEFVSRIPTISTTNRTQPNEEKANLKGKDWQKIHEKLFSKQDPLDVYLEKKNKRMQKLNTPVKSAKRIAAESQKTAEKIQIRRGTQSTKKNSVKKSAQQSFIPKVTSTKTMSLQFATTSTKVSLVNKSRTPVASTNKNKLVKSAKKSPVKSLTDSAKKTTKRSPPKASKLPSAMTSKLPSSKTPSARSPLAKRPFSPYNFGNKSLNKSATGTPNSAQKAKFDLKASLAKPITWKRHTGKLRPIAFGDVEPQYFKLGMNTSIKANRENRRAVTAKSRASNRDNLLNSRRNIK